MSKLYNQGCLPVEGREHALDRISYFPKNPFLLLRFADNSWLLYALTKTENENATLDGVILDAACEIIFYNCKLSELAMRPT